MFQRLFGRNRPVSEAVVTATYEAIVAAARQTLLYSHYGIPDTPLGRFESLSAHLVLYLRRTKDAAAPLPALAQEIVDTFVVDMDHSLRELGIGDQGVPKRMKNLAKMFYGRAESYGAALSKGDTGELAEALRRNILPESSTWSGAEEMALYMLEADAALRTVAVDALAAGKPGFISAGRSKAA
jgi:cytochrome b pre-mRNA-processing protein 3